MAIDISSLSPAMQKQALKKILEEDARKAGKPLAKSKSVVSHPRTVVIEDTEEISDGVKREYRYVIYGDPRTKKNSPQIMGSGRRCPTCRKFEKQWVGQSKAHSGYAKEALKQIYPLPERPIDWPVTCKYIFYMQTHRRVDGLNLMASIDDILVEAGVLEDDNVNIVRDHDGSRVFYDKESPRVEITIREL